MSANYFDQFFGEDDTPQVGAPVVEPEQSFPAEPLQNEGNYFDQFLDDTGDVASANDTPEEPGILTRAGLALMSPVVNPVGHAALVGSLDAGDYLEGRVAQVKATGRQTAGTLAEVPTNFPRRMMGMLLGRDLEEIDISFAGVNLNEFAREQFQKAMSDREEAREKTPTAAIPKFMTEALDAVIEMGPSVATSYITRNPNAALSVMGTTVFGRAYGQARGEGKSTEEAMTDGGIALLTELGPEKALNVFGDLVFGKTVKNLVRVAAKEALTEAITEELQIEDEVFRQGNTDIGAMEAATRIFRAAGLGAVVGGGIAAPSIARQGKVPDDSPDGLDSPLIAAQKVLQNTLDEHAMNDMNAIFDAQERVTVAEESRALEALQTEARKRAAAAGGDALDQELAAAEVALELAPQMAAAAKARQEFFNREKKLAQDRVDQAQRAVERAKIEDQKRKEFEKREKERQREQQQAERQKREDEAQARVEIETRRAEEKNAQEVVTQDEIIAQSTPGPAKGPALAEALTAAGVQDVASLRTPEKPVSQEPGITPLRLPEPVQETAPSNNIEQEQGVDVEISENAAVLEAAHQAASSPINTLQEPAEGSPETAYPTGKVTVNGFNLEMENAPGTERNGRLMSQPYGRFAEVEGADGDKLDVFVGPKPTSSEQVYIIDQVNEDGTFDEHKVMLGYPNQLSAVKAYKQNAAPGRPMGPVTAMTLQEFREVTASGALKTPLSPTLTQPRGRLGLKAKRQRQGMKFQLKRRPLDRVGEPMTAQEASDVVSPLLDRLPVLKNAVTIVENADHLPASVRAGVESDGQSFALQNGGVGGLYVPGDGKIYILANSLRSGEEVVSTVLHEGIGHYGVAIFNVGKKGVNPETVLQEIYDSVSSENSELFQEIVSRYKADLNTREGQLLVADEYVAALAENPELNPSVWSKVVAVVRDFLRDIGLVKKWTDKDIQHLLRNTRKYLSKDRPVERAVLSGLARGDIVFRKDAHTPYVTRPDQTEYPVQWIGVAEQSLIDAFERAKAAGAELTTQRLRAVVGAPVGKHGTPTSYPELVRRMNWALDKFEEDRKKAESEGTATGAHNWYREFAQGLESIVGKPNMREASFIFGITSPRAAVTSNLQNTLIVMMLARQYNPVTQTDRFIDMLYTYRDSLPPGKKGSGLTSANIQKIIRFYRTGEYSAGGMKAVSYANTVLSHIQNTFHPYGVMDTHMGRVFGFNGAPFFGNDRMYRYMQFLTAKLAHDHGIRIEEAQAALWFYAKEHFSDFEGEGTWAEAAEFSSHTIDTIKKMQREGNFSRFKPFSEKTGSGPMAKFEIMGARNPNTGEQSPRKVDPYSNYRHQALIEDALRARAPSVLISLEPGNARGYGFPNDLPFEQRERYRDSVLADITDSSGQIPLLRELGIPHEIETTIGTWEGTMEPSLKITLPGGQLADANLVAGLLGHAFLQDAAITAQPKFTGQDFIAVVRKKNGQEFTPEELASAVENLGMDFTAVDNSGALAFIDGRVYDDTRDYTPEDFTEHVETLSAYFARETYEIEYAKQEGEYVPTEGRPSNLEEIRDKARAAGSPDLQATSIDPLYTAVWNAYREFGQKIGFTPENTSPPIEGLDSYSDPLPAPPVVKPTEGAKIRLSLLPKRMRGTIANNPDSGPLRVLGAGAVTVEEGRKATHSVQEHLKRIGSRISNASRISVLAAVPRNYLKDFLSDTTLMPSIQEYLDNANRMDGRGMTLLRVPAETAKKWHRWAKADPKQGKILGELMLASTYIQADVRKPYKQLSGMTRQQDMQRRAAFKELQRFYNRLDATGQQLYGKIKSDFRKMEKLRNTTLTRQIEASQASDIAKAKLSQYLRQKLEAGRVKGYYFPLHRHGQYWAAARRTVDGPVESFAMFETAYDRDAWVAHQREDGLLVEGKDTGEKMHDDIRNAVHQIDPEFVRRVEGMLGEYTGVEELRDEIWQMYLQSLPEVSIRKAYIHRKGTLGFSGDAIRAYSYGMYHAAKQQSRLEFAPTLRSALTAMEKEAATIAAAEDSPDRLWGPSIYQEMQKRHQLAMNPTPAKWSTNLTGLGFGWYLGVTPAAAMVNLTQTPIFALPTMAARFNNWTKAAQVLGAAYRDVLKRRGPLKMGEALTGDEARAWEEFVNRGVVDQTRGHDVIGLAHEGIEYSEATKTTMEVISWTFHNAEVINRAVTAVAAYRMSKRSGKSHDAAVEEAIELTELSHFNYGITNRPRFMQNNFGRVMFLFRQYSVNATYRMVRDFKDGFLRTQKDPATRKEAKKRFAGLMGMSAIFAGANGLPLYGVTMAILSALLSDDEEEFDAEAALWHWVAETTGDAKWAQLLRKGSWDTITGTSISSRVSLNDLWMREAPSSAEGKALWQHWMTQAFGPVFGIGESVMQGAHQLSNGEVRGLEKMMPKVLTDQLKMIRLATEGAKNYRGDIVVPREDFNILELAGQSLGFAPSDLVQQYDQNRAIMDLSRAIQKRRTGLLERLFLAQRNGDGKEVRETMARIRAFNKAHPQKAINAKSIRESAKQRFDYSLRGRRGITIDDDLLYLYHKYDFTTQESTSE